MEKESGPPGGAADTVKPISAGRRTLLYISLCCGMFLSLIDTSIVSTALFTIGSDFAALDRVTWVALAYTLAYIGFAVPFAALGDVLGRRNAYLLAFTIFLAFSMGAGFAQNITELIACRALQGIGGAGLYSLTMVIFPEVTPPHRNAVIAALAGAVVAVSGIAGPVLGGVVTHYATWRWVFWLNGPVAVFAMALFLVSWPAPEQMRTSHTRRKWSEFDFVGMLLLIAASVLFVYAFQEAGINTDSWATASFLAPLLVGCLCWALLFAWEWAVDRFWRERIAAVVPLGLLRQRIYGSGVLFTLLIGFPYFIAIFSLPLRFQAVNGTTPLLAGIWLLPMLGASAVGSTVAGAVNSKRGHIAVSFLAGGALLTIGCGLLTTLDASTALDSKVYGFEVLVGFGFGIMVATTSISSSLEPSLRNASVAQGIVAQVRVFGGSIGIAASTAILGVTQRRELAGLVTPAQIASLESSRATLSPLQLQAVQQSYADALTLQFKVCTIIAAVSLLVALGTWRRGPALDVIQRRKDQAMEEQQRVRALIAAAGPAQEPPSSSNSRDVV